MLPFIRGLAGWLRRRPLLGRIALSCLPDVEIGVLVPEAGKFRIRLRRHRSYWLRHPLTHETFALGALKKLISPDDVVYDVGANIGVYTRLALRFGASTVVAFEPMTENLELLRKNVKLGNVEGRVEIRPTALCSRDGTEPLQIDNIMSGSASLSAVTGGQASQGRAQYGLPPLTEMVQCARLDSLLAQGTIPPPMVMKIDIEGGESEMLSGAENTLDRCAPKLLVELHGVDRARSVYELLSRLGYACFGVVRRDSDCAYRMILPEDIAGLRDYYDLQFILASRNQDDLVGPVEPFPANLT